MKGGVVLDFAALKKIPLTSVCARYGIALTFGGKYAKAKCPLPTHKAGDKDKNFNINLEGNYWKCWSESCNEKAGAKGGDVINFVAVMDGCSQHEAAKKLAGWFPLTEKPAPHIEKRAPEKSPKGPQKDSSDHTSPGDSVKGYMQDVDAWFEQLVAPREGEEDDVYWKRIRNGVKSRLIESFKNGKRQAQGLPVPQNS
jgi:hypothetical protein